MVNAIGTMAAAGAAATMVATSTAVAAEGAATVIAFQSRSDLVLRTGDGEHVHINDRGPDSYTLHSGTHRALSEPMTRALADALIPKTVEGMHFPLFGRFRVHISTNQGLPEAQKRVALPGEIDIKTFLTKMSTTEDTPAGKELLHNTLRELVHAIETYPEYLMREDVVDILKMIMERGIATAAFRVIISERPGLFTQEDMPLIAQIAKRWPGAEWDMLRLLAVRDDLTLSIDTFPLTHGGEQPARA